MEDNLPEDNKEHKPKSMPEAAPETVQPEEALVLVSITDFQKTDLRVGQIIEAERVPKSEKLLRLQVDLGEKLGRRQIVSGIAKFYSVDELIGRKIAVVANLEPAKLMGLESRGMLLAASDDLGNLEILSVGESLSPGSTIR